VRSALMKIAFVVILAGWFAGCAGGAVSPPVGHSEGHIVQGGSLATEGMIYFPLGLPNDKK